MRRRRLLLLIGSILGVCLLVFLVGTAAYYFLKPGEEAGPVVLIRAPLFGEQVNANELTMVQAVARAPKGVTRVELWVDGSLLAVKTSQLPQGSTPFPLIEGWYPKTPGKHILIVRAYNRALRSGQATVLVEALDLPKALPQQTYPVQEGDTLASIAESHGLTVEEIAARNPGINDPLPPGDTITLPLPSPESEGEPPPEFAPPEPLPGEGPPTPIGRETPPLIARLFSPFMRLPSGRWLEVEALSLEVGEDYDGVYCYYSLGGTDMERVPADGFLEGLGERRWSIEGAMGGERRRVVIIPEGEGGLEIQGNCLGYRASAGGGELFDLGSLVIRHTEPEWDGRRIEQLVTGRDGWFRVNYRLGGEGPSMAEKPPKAPGDLPTLILSAECAPVWAWTGRTPEGEGIWMIPCVIRWRFPPSWLEASPESRAYPDGFLVLRNGALFSQEPYGAEAIEVSHDPGETYEYQVIAYQGDPFADPPAGWRSPPSNAVTIGSELWPKYKRVWMTFHYLKVGAIGCIDWPWPGVLCTSSEYYPEDRGPGVYGGVSVNGIRAFNIRYPLHPGTRYDLPPSFGYSESPRIDLTLSPSESLTISSRMWDYDVSSDDDPFCIADYVYGPDDLERILEEDEAIFGGRYGARLVMMQEFNGGEGNCYLGYTIQVWETEGPPPPTIIP